jgi:hypothetical protein
MSILDASFLELLSPRVLDRADRELSTLGQRFTDSPLSAREAA